MISPALLSHGRAVSLWCDARAGHRTGQRSGGGLQSWAGTRSCRTASPLAGRDAPRCPPALIACGYPTYASRTIRVPSPLRGFGRGIGRAVQSLRVSTFLDRNGWDRCCCCAVSFV